MFYTNGLTLHRRRTLENGFHGTNYTYPRDVDSDEWRFAL